MSAGSTKPRAGTAERRQAFVQAYVANGHNATQAAIAAGYSAKNARAQGVRMLTNANIRAKLAALAERTAEEAELNITAILREVTRLCLNDPSLFLKEDGSIKPATEWTPAMKATVASLEVSEEFEGQGENRRLVGYTKKLKFWDKNAALEKAMKHLGLFEKHNQQKPETLNLKVTLVPAPVRRVDHND